MDLEARISEEEAKLEQAKQMFARSQQLIAEGHQMQAQAQMDYAKAEGALSVLRQLAGAQGLAEIVADAASGAAK